MVAGPAAGAAVAALAQRLAIDTRKRFWRILGPDFQVLDEGEVTRGCNP